MLSGGAINVSPTTRVLLQEVYRHLNGILSAFKTWLDSQPNKN